MVRSRIDALCSCFTAYTVIGKPDRHVVGMGTCRVIVFLFIYIELQLDFLPEVSFRQKIDKDTVERTSDYLGIV